LHKLIPAERKDRTVIVAIAPDAMEKLGDIIPKVKAKTDGQFLVTLLSDADHAVIDRYGLLNAEAAARGRFLPHPTTYVLDRKGVVRWKFTEKDYKVRPTNEAILKELMKLE
jgi:peroxiredoxin